MVGIHFVSLWYDPLRLTGCKTSNIYLSPVSKDMPKALQIISSEMECNSPDKNESPVDMSLVCTFTARNVARSHQIVVERCTVWKSTGHWQPLYRGHWTKESSTVDEHKKTVQPFQTLQQKTRYTPFPSGSNWDNKKNKISINKAYSYI